VKEWIAISGWEPSAEGKNHREKKCRSEGKPRKEKIFTMGARRRASRSKQPLGSGPQGTESPRGDYGTWNIKQAGRGKNRTPIEAERHSRWESKPFQFHEKFKWVAA